MRKARTFAWAVLLPLVLFCATPLSAQLLDPSTLTKFIDPLPQPEVRTPSGKIGGADVYDVHIRQASQKLHSELGSTTVFTYDGVTPGPTFLVKSNDPIYVNYYNDLPLHHILPVDENIYAMQGMGWGDKPRTVTHLHGGDVPDIYDGGPLATIDPGQMTTYWYPNSQDAATLWYHDHAMGITRLNAYAGIAGFYIITDPHERRLGMPEGPYEIGIALQDRQLYADGQLYYPAAWEPEHFGDVALVNGVIWPKLEVEPRKYRIHFLAGGNDRYWNIKLLESDAQGNVVNSIGGPAFYQVGTDQGLMPNTAVFNDPLNPASPRLLMGPGKRYDVIIDFAGQQGKYFLMHNNAKTPFKGIDNPAPDDVPLPELFLVHVKDMMVDDNSVIPMTPGKYKVMDQLKADFTRDIVMEEMMDEFGNITELLLNGKHFDAPVTELPEINNTEVWRWINTTEDVHPMHMHLVKFQVVDRQPFDVPLYLETGQLVFTGPAVGPELGEVGWMDTQNAPPGYVTRTIARFTRLGNYVYHCHILAHEENDMMRPFTVVPRHGGAMDAGLAELREFSLSRSFPDPFQARTSIAYSVPFEQPVELRVYNSLGQEVKTLVDQSVNGGTHNVTWDATDNAGSRVAAGTYFYKLNTVHGIKTQKTTLLQ